MLNPGPYTLAALPISAARSLALLTPITGLAGMLACNIEANFQGATAGTSLSAIVATSFDGGTLWRHVARFDWTTTPSVKTVNLSGLTPKGIISYADLAVEGVTDGLLGDQLAVYLVSVGAYTNSTLSIRAQCR
jgi:hypothetical protein